MFLEWWFKIFGILGLIAIIVGIIIHGRYIRDIIYIVGGLFLTVYSIYLGDWIFIILQCAFTAVALFDLFHYRHRS